MQDDFSSVHRMARQKKYDPSAGIHGIDLAHAVTACIVTQSLKSGTEISAIDSNTATIFLASQLFIMPY